MSKKRAMSLLLALTLCLCLFPVSAFAAEDGLFINDGVLWSYSGPGGDVVIPDGVTEIGSRAFEDCTSLTSVTIPDSVTTISHFAFYGCTGLTSVTMPNSVTTIGTMAFSCTGLTSVTIPDSLTAIGMSAFSGCNSLASVTIPVNVIGIGREAFVNCTSLTAITIPDSVTMIGDEVFGGCTGLKSVTIGNSVTEIGESAFYGCTNLTDVYFTGSKEQWDAIQIKDDNDPLLNATIHYNSPMPEAPKPTAAPSPQTVLVDGKKTDFAMYALNDGATNYIRVRDLAVILNGTAAQFGVGYDEATESVTLTSKTAYEGTTDKAPFTANMAYTDYTKPTYVDGKAVQLEAIQIEHNGLGYTYYKLRDLGQALGFNVGYDEATDTVYIETNKPYDHNN